MKLAAAPGSTVGQSRLRYSEQVVAELATALVSQRQVKLRGHAKEVSFLGHPACEIGRAEASYSARDDATMKSGTTCLTSGLPPLRAAGDIDLPWRSCSSC